MVRPHTPISHSAGLPCHHDVPVAPKTLDAVENTVVTVILDEAAVGNQVLGAVCDPAKAVEDQVEFVLRHG